MKDPIDQINDLDHLYTSLTGFQFKVRGVCSPHQEGWFRFIKAGFTAADLTLTVRWIQRRIKEGKRDIGALRWSTLIGSIDRFDEEWAMAKSESRNTKPSPTPKEKAVSQLRPVIEQTWQTGSDAKPVSYWIQKMREEVR